MINYAEVQRRYDAGEFTLNECRRHGWNHHGYGWACNPPGHFTPEQKAAYLDGYEKGKAGEYVSSREDQNG